MKHTLKIPDENAAQNRERAMMPHLGYFACVCEKAGAWDVVGSDLVWPLKTVV